LVGRPGGKLECNIEIGLKKIRWGVECINLVQDAWNGNNKPGFSRDTIK
jgi:hypothetical protein